jgi:hypothetical protein
MDVLAYPQGLRNPCDLQQCAGADAILRIAWVGPKDANVSGRRFRQAEEHAYGGGFSCAVGAEEREELAARDGEIETAYCLDGTVVLRDSSETDSVHASQDALERRARPLGNVSSVE